MQWSISEEVITDARSLSSALTSKVTNGLRMKPLRIVSRIAVTLVNNTQIPITDLGIIRTMKNKFRKPKNTTVILFINENAPVESQREYACEAKTLNFFNL
jgi:hypothetical protein